MVRHLLRLVGALAIAVPFFVARPVTAQDAGQDLIGTWKIISRTTTANGERVAEPGIGDQPVGYLVYTASGHVSGQLMRPGRSAAEMKSCGVAQTSAQNNSTSVCGYDAYFGTYKLDGLGGIIHHLELALSPDDVGKDIRRSFVVNGDRLTITYPTALLDGTPATRTLVWQRIR